MAKKAVLVNIDLLVRVIVDDFVDLDVDPEFDEVVTNAVRGRLSEEGISFIAEGINDYREDEENPYDPEYD
jgi:hypothetical protein